MPVSVEKHPTPVVVLTPWSRIRGTHHIVPGVRVSDSLNSDVATRARYLPLTDAVVTDLATATVVFQSQFLMVAHAHIVCLAPASEVDAAGDTPMPASRAHALASDMEQLLQKT